MNNNVEQRVATRTGNKSLNIPSCFTKIRAKWATSSPSAFVSFSTDHYLDETVFSSLSRRFQAIRCSVLYTILRQKEPTTTASQLDETTCERVAAATSATANRAITRTRRRYLSLDAAPAWISGPRKRIRATEKRLRVRRPTDRDETSSLGGAKTSTRKPHVH